MSTSKEVYTVVLKPFDGSGTDTSSVTFFVNWESILPTPPQKYLLKAVFHAYCDYAALDYIEVEVTGIHAQLWDSRLNGKSDFVALAYPVFNGRIRETSDDYLFSNHTHPLDLLINKPTENSITVKLWDYNRNPIDVTDYSLVLQLSPIISPPQNI